MLIVCACIRVETRALRLHLTLGVGIWRWRYLYAGAATGAYAFIRAGTCAIQHATCPVQLVVRKFNPLLRMSTAAYEECFGLLLDFGDAGGAETRAVTDDNKAEYVTARYVLVQYVGKSGCQDVSMLVCQYISVPLSMSVCTRGVPPHHHMIGTFSATY